MTDWSATRAIPIHRANDVRRDRSTRCVVMTLGLLTGVAAVIAARRRRSAAQRAGDGEPSASRWPRHLLLVLAHELRTPLNSIVAWTEVLQSGKAGAAVTATALNSIASSALTQRRLIEDIVDSMRAEQSELRLRMTVLDLRSPVRTAVDLVRPSAESANLVLSVALPSTICHVRGDSDRLQQAFSNVLTNAVKFTRQGGIHVSLVKRDRDYQVRVVDTGTGIDREFLPLVFTRFQQAHGSGRRHSGLGLGLAICRDLISQHHGRVRVESDGLGHGTTVDISLPALADEHSPI